MIARYRRFIGRHCRSWCLVAIVLSVLQPFLFTHFQRDGWDDEPGFRVRNAGAMALFSPDDRTGHQRDLETTLFVPTAAHLEQPDALDSGLAALMALFFSLLPLTVVIRGTPLPREAAFPERMAFASRAPPPAAPWRCRPPKAAPPSTR